jgi:hypothetical protein
MQNYLRILTPVLACAFFAGAAHAQVTDQIRADIGHNFMIGDKTFPPGKYIFRILPDSELALMSVTSADNKIHLQFSVRQTKSNHVPAHSELVFHRYGDTEVLAKIFEKGESYGSEVSMNNKQEARLAQGGKPVEHTEEQK